MLQDIRLFLSTCTQRHCSMMMSWMGPGCGAVSRWPTPRRIPAARSPNRSALGFEMDLIRTSIERPIAVVSAVLMILLFGILALETIPVQLAPDVRKPVITVTTSWFGAAPAEIEREIVNRQEDALKGLDGLEEMISRSTTGQGEITLEFQVGQNMDRALLLVANRLDRVVVFRPFSRETMREILGEARPVLEGVGGDPSSGAELTWSFPVAASTPIQVRLYFANRCRCTDEPGDRVFDVDVEGVEVINELDMTDDHGHETGVAYTFDLVSDGAVFSTIRVHLVFRVVFHGFNDWTGRRLRYGGNRKNDSAIDRIRLDHLQLERGDPPVRCHRVVVSNLAP